MVSCDSRFTSLLWWTGLLGPYLLLSLHALGYFPELSVATNWFFCFRYFLAGLATMAVAIAVTNWRLHQKLVAIVASYGLMIILYPVWAVAIGVFIRCVYFLMDLFWAAGI